MKLNDLELATKAWNVVQKDRMTPPHIAYMCKGIYDKLRSNGNSLSRDQREALVGAMSWSLGRLSVLPKSDWGRNGKW